MSSVCYGIGIGMALQSARLMRFVRCRGEKAVRRHNVDTGGASRFSVGAFGRGPIGPSPTVLHLNQVN